MREVLGSLALNIHYISLLLCLGQLRRPIPSVLQLISKRLERRKSPVTQYDSLGIAKLRHEFQEINDTLSTKTID